MKSGVLIAGLLLWSSVVMADGPDLWTVALVGARQPYICNECGLKTPLPDLASARALNAWKATQPPFNGPIDYKGVSRPIKSGDQVTLCNKSGCSTYTWEEPAGWGQGIFQRQEPHAPNRAG